MLRIVRIALTRPYTFIVMALLILLLGALWRQCTCPWTSFRP